MPKFELNHTCNKPSCKGHAGEVINISDKDVAYLLERGGGELFVEPDPEPDEMTPAQKKKAAAEAKKAKAEAAKKAKKAKEEKEKENSGKSGK